ncbi:hypothetical protein CCR75_003490 [Bremia lactucae]|uniref:Programmed cell death protein 2 C-terminal domain-containing protein n=1 Tax=Bremia lactucae TaxID=4779 RepID=A0A976IGU0_BRELC|nr:hypothetical protein CCR75_003490 [Bremia lactucae]
METNQFRSLDTHSLIESQVAREEMIPNGTKWVFPTYELVIDQEPDTREAANEFEAKLLAEFEKHNTQDIDEDDMNVSQRELNEALGHTTDQDPHYVRFLTRVAIAKKQVLRYSRWQNDAVLWVHSKGVLNHHDVPPCNHCGHERKFEFQVLPQLLTYLHVDHLTSLHNLTSRSCEWGTLAIYTCVKSCSGASECVEEFLHYQPAYLAD